MLPFWAEIFIDVLAVVAWVATFVHLAIEKERWVLAVLWLTLGMTVELWLLSTWR